VTEPGERTVWSFPEGSVGHDQSVKEYAVEATDGCPSARSRGRRTSRARATLVVSYDDTHHVVPAGAVRSSTTTGAL